MPAPTTQATAPVSARRRFMQWLGAAGGALSAASATSVQAKATAVESQPPSAPPAPELPAMGHDMSDFPASWTGHEQIALLLYPGFTALDLMGPQYMLGGLLGAQVHLVAETLDPVTSDTGVRIVPSLRLADCPAVLDVLFIPGGGEGTLAALRNEALVSWLADRGRQARLLASVCTGSLLLGQAGLLRGRKATSHWVARDLLAGYGAEPVAQRVVWDGQLVTGAGVSAGLDLGLSILGRLRDDDYAQMMQLMAEYAPEPPYQSGTPEQATPRVYRLVANMFDDFRASVRQASSLAHRA